MKFLIVLISLTIANSSIAAQSWDSFVGCVQTTKVISGWEKTISPEDRITTRFTVAPDPSKYLCEKYKTCQAFKIELGSKSNGPVSLSAYLNQNINATDNEFKSYFSGSIYNSDGSPANFRKETRIEITKNPDGTAHVDVRSGKYFYYGGSEYELEADVVYVPCP